MHERIGKGDTVVVVRIGRLAGSLSHLLEVIERLETKVAFFCSILDPIDTGFPRSKFTPQVLGAAAEFERAQFREHTKDGFASASIKGSVGGKLSTQKTHPSERVEIGRKGNNIAFDVNADPVPHFEDAVRS